jgi:transposase-like protein
VIENVKGETMNIVCPFCRAVSEITIKAVSYRKTDFAVYRCIVCNHEFQVSLIKIIAPKSKEEIYLIPKITKADSAKIISENLPKTVRDEIW